MIICQTPLRVSFFGGGTDFPAFYERHGGVTISTTIQQYCYISLHALSPFFTERHRAHYARTEQVVDAADFEHPLIRECMRYVAPEKGLEISHVADLPGRTGLGSSSAFTVGLLHALHAFHGRRVTAEDLARQAIHIERERVGDAGGHQDQYAAAYGGFIRIDYRPSGQIAVTRLAAPAERLQELESHVLVFFTGAEQSAETLLREQDKNTGRNEAALLRMRDLAEQAEAVLLSDTDIHAFGELLHEAWMLKRSLSSGISTSSIDQLYDRAVQAGATGGKLLGAGGRGFLLLWAPPDRHEAIRAALPNVSEIRFACSFEGSRIIYKEPE
jgi:D-glycero-alpha-D-manno-heptose-7-phosphate kinase